MSVYTNQTACVTLWNQSTVRCLDFVRFCDDGTDYLERIFFAISIPLLLIATLYALKGSANLVIGGKLLVENCRCQDAHVELYSGHTSQKPFWHAVRNPNRFYNKKVMVIWQLFGGIKDCTIASLPFMLAYILLNTPHEVSAKVCHRFSCPDFAQDAYASCGWAEEWLIDVIQSIFHGRVHS